jgi:nitrite reductase/ring-hydroxylating ferredoxin subunit
MLAPLSDDDSLEAAADITLATGLAAAVGSAVTGLTDWKDTYGEERSVGLLHGLTMLTGTLLYTQSLISRRTGSRSAGLFFSTLGYGLIAAGAYLGGDEVYDLGYPVNHTAFDHAPSKFVPLIAESDLKENSLARADASGVSVLLARVDGQVYALDDTCVHAGCSLAGGNLDGYTVTCPCHFSQYDIRDGSVINGPATMPEQTYEVRINAGMIEVKG